MNIFINEFIEMRTLALEHCIDVGHKCNLKHFGPFENGLKNQFWANSFLGNICLGNAEKHPAKQTIGKGQMKGHRLDPQIGAFDAVQKDNLPQNPHWNKCDYWEIISDWNYSWGQFWGRGNPWLLCWNAMQISSNVLW